MRWLDQANRAPTSCASGAERADAATSRLRRAMGHAVRRSTFRRCARTRSGCASPAPGQPVAVRGRLQMWIARVLAEPVATRVAATFRVPLCVVGTANGSPSTCPLLNHSESATPYGRAKRVEKGGFLRGTTKFGCSVSSRGPQVRGHKHRAWAAQAVGSAGFRRQHLSGN